MKGYRRHFLWMMVLLLLFVWSYAVYLNPMKQNKAFLTPMTVDFSKEEGELALIVSNPMDKNLDTFIGRRSIEFVITAFKKDTKKLSTMLALDAKYIISPDGSSFIRHVSNGTHVEGYMATDKKLMGVRHKWHLKESDGKLVSCVEVYVENEMDPQLWYIHYTKQGFGWKISMLENGD